MPRPTGSTAAFRCIFLAPTLGGASFFGVWSSFGDAVGVTRALPPRFVDAAAAASELIVNNTAPSSYGERGLLAVLVLRRGGESCIRRVLLLCGRSRHAPHNASCERRDDGRSASRDYNVGHGSCSNRRAAAAVCRVASSAPSGERLQAFRQRRRAPRRWWWW